MKCLTQALGKHELGAVQAVRPCFVLRHGLLLGKFCTNNISCAVRVNPISASFCGQNEDDQIGGVPLTEGRIDTELYGICLFTKLPSTFTGIVEVG